MIFDLDIITNLLIQTVGFEQSGIDECVPFIHPELLANSGSGKLNIKYVQGANQFLSNEFLFKNLNEFQKQTKKVPIDYNVATLYNIGSRVTLPADGFVYVSRIDVNIGNVPVFDSDFWETELSSYLRNMITRTSRQFASDVSAAGQHLRNMNQVIDSTQLFLQYQIDSTEVFSDRFQGYKIQFKQINNLALEITHIGVNFDTVQDVIFYLYHTSQKDAISSTSVSISVADVDKFVWKKLDIPIRVSTLALNHNAGGAWLLGFFEGVGVGQAQGGSRSIHWSSGMVTTSTLYNWGFSLIRPSVFGANKLNGIEIPQMSDFFESDQIEETTTFNLAINQTYDYDYPFTQFSNMFAQVLQYDIAITLLNNIATSNFESSSKATFRDEIPRLLLGVQTESGQVMSKGLIGIREMHFKNLNENLSRIDSNTYENRQRAVITY